MKNPQKQSPPPQGNRKNIPPQRIAGLIRCGPDPDADAA